MDDILIEELELGVRSYNCLKRAGIQTVGDLVSKSEAELAAIPNFGKKSIDEVIETLHARGLALHARASSTQKYGLWSFVLVRLADSLPSCVMET